MAADSLVLVEKDTHVATLTLNRPEKLNALSRELVADLLRAFDEAGADDDVRVVLLRGAGRAFSAGADLGGPRPPGGRTVDEWDGRIQHGLDALLHVRDFPKPVVTAIHGYCLGRGMELALWSGDVVIAADDTRLGEPEVRQGLLEVSMVPWLANPQLAKLFLFCGDTITAQEARELGLVARVVPRDQLDAESQRIARRIAKTPPYATRYTKKAVNGVLDAMGFRDNTDYGEKLELLSYIRMPEAKNVHGVSLEETLREQGLKAFLQARDSPFAED